MAPVTGKGITRFEDSAGGMQGEVLALGQQRAVKRQQNGSTALAGSVRRGFLLGKKYELLISQGFYGVHIFSREYRVRVRACSYNLRIITNLLGILECQNDTRFSAVVESDFNTGDIIIEEREEEFD